MKSAIIGRKNEIEKLEGYLSSDRSEFIAIYGRRRVGKTFLIKELLDGRFTFKITGKENVSQRDQLINFSYALSDHFEENTIPNDWSEAFRLLSKSIERTGKGTKIIFIDELPWFDSQRSKFLSSLEYFWNSWAYYRSDVKLIVCGSATSWMLNNIINSRGGLHNRVTHKILISPFTLNETELYFKHNGFNYEQTEIIDCYMAVGGVAYYLSLFNNNKSVAENINALFFENGGELTDEFDRLYKSIFKKAENHISIITALGTVGRGLTRIELMQQTKLSNNGNLTTTLKELEECEFIRSFSPFGKSKKEKMYQLIDQLSLFHIRFMNYNRSFAKDFWIKNIGTGEYNAWCGYAFETVCLHHIDQIINALGISGTINTPCSWAYRPTKEVESNVNVDDDLKTGAQIDLVIDRNDKTINVCEMKYSNDEFEITKSYNERIQNRVRTFKKVTKTKKTIVPVFITPFGLRNNAYSRQITKSLTAEDLFS